MSASRARLAAPIRALFLLTALAAPAMAAGPGHGPVPARDAARELRVRSALEPDRALATQLEALRRRRAPDSLNLFVVGCDFSDSLMVGRDRSAFPGWPAPRRQAQRIPGTDIPVFAAHDSTYFDLQIRRVDAYFRTVSFGAFSLEWTVEPRIQNLPRPMGHYADPDSGTVRLARMAQDIVDALDATVDFGAFDTLVLIHAGAGAETDVRGDSPEQIPSNYLDRFALQEAYEAGVLAAPAIVSAEREFEHVLVLPESETQDPVEGVPGSGFFDVRGVWCYELGLRLGMLSLADFTPASYPDSQGIGNFGLMGYGLFTGIGIVPSAPSAINRMLMGWAQPVDVRADADLRIAPMIGGVTAVTDTSLVRVPVTDREYWLLEYRLQDPDGDLFYSFGDLNGNYVPDYYDQSNAANGGVPASTFDPSEDVWEDETGAEVDFFMSENPARSSDGCQRGGGSGLYIWHVDEQVIRNALLANSNTINADARHKGVDVEEADGIQDLDSAQGSAWLLGGDADVWRGEGKDEFGPDTNPSTRTAAGLATGVRFSEISDVVVDSLPRVDGYCTGFVYAPAMRVHVAFGASAAGPQEQGRRRFEGYGPQTDLRIVDLGSGPLSPAPDGRDELVALADSGRVLVLDGALDGFGASGPEDGTLAVAVGGDSLAWIGPPAVSDFDGDGRSDLIGATAQGLFGFGLDGLELVDGDVDPTTLGRIVDPGGTGLSRAVAMTDSEKLVQVVQAGPDLRLVVADLDATGSLRILRTNPVGAAMGTGGLVVGDGSTVWAGYAGASRTGSARFDVSTGSAAGASRDDGFARGAAVTVALPQLGPGAVWIDAGGRPRAAAAPDFAGPRSGPAVDGLRSAPVVVPARQGGAEWVVAFVTADALWAFDANLSVRPGFPARAGGLVAVAPDASLPGPVAVDLDGDGTVEFVWCDASGGLHATDLQGRELAGWPVQGPSSPVSAPVLGQLDDDPALEMAVAGRFEQLVAAADGGYRTRTAGEIRVYDLAAPVVAWRPWNQALGAVDNRSVQPLTTAVPAGSGLVQGSFSVRPNPVRGSKARLRVDAAGPVRARLDIYNLEGQRVLSRGPLDIPAGTALDEEFDVGDLGSGTYICQLSAGGEVQRALMAVVR